MHSPLRRPKSPTRRVHPDSGSTASSDPRARRDSAKFFMNDNKKTLEPASSAVEKRDVNPTSALGSLLACMRQGNQAIYRTR